MTRSGLSALVTMTRTNPSVDVSATVPSGRSMSPALTTRRSNVLWARRSGNAAICAGTVMSTVQPGAVPHQGRSGPQRIGR
jgi:hypothetical protein